MSKFLIAGLGNIGEEYEHTRHNIGFDVADALVKSCEGKFTLDKHAHVAEIKFKGKLLVVIKPTTYMNLSGKAINYWLQKEQLHFRNLLVITDDLSLPFGKLRLKGKGSDGGHNGLKSIQETLNTTEYARLRFGIGNDFPKGRQADFVLSKWNEEELKQLEEKILKGVDTVKSFCTIGIERTMTSFNSNS